MIGVKVDKNKSQATVQKKSNAANKSLSSAPVAQLCGGCGEKDDKSKTEKDGATAFSTRNSFWSPDTIQGKFENGIKQLKSSPSFPTIQLQNKNNAPVVQRATNNTGLPDNVKTGTERLSGVSLSDVKVEYNSNKPAQLSAHAYAQGTNIYVGPGQEKHIPHEAWHVVQQKQGRVQATTQMKGMVPVNDDAGLEREADVMGAKAVQMAKMDEEEAPVQQKAIGNNGEVAQLGIMDWLRGKSKDKKDSTSLETIDPLAINANTEDKGVETRPKSNAITERPPIKEKGLLGKFSEGFFGKRNENTWETEGGLPSNIYNSFFSGKKDENDKGGFVSNMLGGTKDATKSVSNAFFGNKEDKKDGWLSNMWGGTKDATKSVSNAFFGNKEDKKDGWLSNMWGGTKDTASNLTKWGDEDLGKANMSSWSGVGNGISGVFKKGMGYLGALGTGVLGTAATIGTGVLGTAATIGTGVLGTAATIGTGVLGTAATIGTGVLGTAATAGTGLVGGATTTAVGAAGLVPAGIAKGTDWTLNNYGHNNDRYTKDTKKDFGKHIGQATSGILNATTGSASGVQSIHEFIHGKDSLDIPFSKDNVLTEAGIGMAAGGAVMGGAAGIIAAYQSGKQMFSKGVDKTTRMKAGGNMISSLAGGVSSAGKLIGGSAVGVLGVVTGGIEMAKGIMEWNIAGDKKSNADQKIKQILTEIIDYFTNQNDAEKLPIIKAYGTAKEIVENNNYYAIYKITDAYSKEENAPNAEEYKSVASLASHLSKKQSNAKISAGGTVAKGAIAVIGGGLLLGGLASGGAVLGLAAVVGIGLLVHDYIKKQKNRKEIALREFGIVDKQAKWEKDIKEINGTFSWWNKKEKKQQRAAAGLDDMSPLDKELRDHRFDSLGDWYANYISDKAENIRQNYYINGDQNYEEIIISLGLKTKKQIDSEHNGIVKDENYPSKKQIGKAING